MSPMSRTSHYLLEVADPYSYGIAIAEPGVNFMIMPKHGSGVVSDWCPIKFRMELGEFGNKTPGFPDLMVTNISNPLMSQLLRSIIDEHRGPHDQIQWLSMHITSEDGTETREYFALHFPDPPDLLNHNNCMYVGEGRARSLFLPSFWPEALARHEICTYRGRSNSPPIVSLALSRAIKRAECTAVQFERAPTGPSGSDRALGRAAPHPFCISHRHVLCVSSVAARLQS